MANIKMETIESQMLPPCRRLAHGTYIHNCNSPVGGASLLTQTTRVASVVTQAAESLNYDARHHGSDEEHNR